MATTPKIGTSEWWTGTADKLIDFGLGVISYKTSVPRTSQFSNAAPSRSVLGGGFSNALPWILGAAGVAGVVLLMRKR